MIPSQVCFTGVNIDPCSLLYEHTDRLVPCPYPSHYTRLEFSSPMYTIKSLYAINNWIRENVFGRWGSYVAENLQTVVLFFEDASDAILFKLLDGPTICIEEAIK